MEPISPPCVPAGKSSIFEDPAILPIKRNHINNTNIRIFFTPSDRYISVGRCVIPWEFLGKSVKHIFSCREMYSDYDKRCFQFFLVVLTSR